MSKKKNYVWRVTNSGDGIDLAFGPELSEAPYSDDAKVQMLGKALIKIGTQLMTSTTGEDDDEYYD